MRRRAAGAIDIDALPPGPDGTPAAEDFVPESQTTCGVGFLYASTVYAYNEENIPGEKPATMADFFHLEKFPGRRGMRHVPQGNGEVVMSTAYNGRIFNAQVLERPSGSTTRTS